MTFIQPNKNSGILNKILAVLVICSVFSGAALVVLYNRIVNFDHGLDKAKAELASLQSQNADAKDKIFELLDTDKDSAALKDYGLVEDKNPQYLEISSKDENSQQWSYASGR